MGHYLAPRAPEEPLYVSYYWHPPLGGWGHVTIQTTEAVPQPIVHGSAEEFITEHYWDYTGQRDGGTVEYRVEHPSWRVWQSEKATVTGDLEELYGHDFAKMLAQPPDSPSSPRAPRSPSTARCGSPDPDRQAPTQRQ